MCDPKGTADEKGNVDIICQISGLPITESNEYGMFCANYCELEAARKAYEMLERLVKAFS
jgi:hypothetical protein